MRILVTLGMLLAISAGASGQTREAEQVEVTTVIVPVVGSVLGASGVRWKTDVELRNDMNAEVTVAMALPAAGPDRFMIVSIPPGETLRYIDVGQAFGVDATLSPLVVQTEGRRSVTIRATAYGSRGAEVFPPQPITINYGPTYSPTRVLQNLSFNDDVRTNLGLVNLGETPAEFVLALQRVPGRNLAVNRVRLPPNALWHMAIQMMFPLISHGEHFSVVVETPARDTHIYASVVDNHTQAAKFVQPTVGISTVTPR
jgi:hypothetical protein